MKLEPLKSYRTAYPNQYEVDLKPLLLSVKPKSWTSASSTALILCALAVAGTTGCVGIASNPSGGINESAISEEINDAENLSEGITEPTLSEEMDDDVKLSEDIQIPPIPRKMNVAPIFDGSEMDGGLTFSSNNGFLPVLSVMSYTTSLSSKDYSIVPLGNYPGFSMPMPEEAALKIISEELSKNGLIAEVSNKQVPVAGDNMDETQWSFDLSVSGGKEPIYIEYLPSASAETEPELLERTSACLPEDSLVAAQSLHNKLAEVYDESTAAIFYDNQMVMSIDETANLKAQVAEFVEWLKTMGLI